MNLQPTDNKHFTLNCRGKLISLEKPLLMGILNITPDSFSDGGLYTNEKSALLQTEKMIKEGAHIIDVGPQSSNPWSTQINAAEERQRLGKILSKMKQEFPETLLSIDSFYSETVKFAADEGIDIINDISGGQFDKDMFETVASLQLPYILMHINPSFETRHHKIKYEDITVSINRFFFEKIAVLNDLSVTDILLDPGFGFGKTIEDQYQMIEDASFFGLGKFPLFIGISRKSFIYKKLNKSPLEIEKETQKLHLKLLKKGAKVLRVHNVAATRETLKIFSES